MSAPSSEYIWTEGNRFRLLVNGEAFFPFVNAAIETAKEEVLIDTFILFDDSVGQALKGALIAAARRGVRVRLVVDGYGSADLPAVFVDALRAAGVDVVMFAPGRRLFTVRTNWYRRLHCKTVLVDGHVAIVGGINFSDEHLRSFGPKSKQDYAVAVEGPAVEQVRRFFVARHGGSRTPPRRRWWRSPFAPRTASGAGGAMLVVRDNTRHRDDIEHMYRLGIRAARRRIVIANAYFLPGYRMIRDLRNAARRGVDVHLILQGNPDEPIVRTATLALHDALLAAGVHIHEFRERPLHAKVAVIDDEWSTVGSSNLDPLSLFLNLESNLLIRDAGFTAQLAEELEGLIRGSCEEIAGARGAVRGWARRMLSAALFHGLRRLPARFGYLPGHRRARLPRGGGD